ncbi:hypothetical protein BSKO_10337 [Bryopsis sp. KO-2023]|nr:hypothetical protein BSKO_10337 [Bryopsis sp. KO-2023]
MTATFSTPLYLESFSPQALFVSFNQILTVFFTCRGQNFSILPASIRFTTQPNLDHVPFSAIHKSLGPLVSGHAQHIFFFGFSCSSFLLLQNHPMVGVRPAK